MAIKSLAYKRQWRRLYRRKDRAQYKLEHPAIRHHRISWQLTPEARDHLQALRAEAFWRRQAGRAMVAT